MTWCCAYCWCPLFLKIYRFFHRKRVESHLDTMDKFDVSIRIRKKKGPRIIVDAETGEITFESMPTGGGESSDEEKFSLSLRFEETKEDTEKREQDQKLAEKKKKMGRRKLEKLEKKLAEDEQYYEALRKAVYVPLREERLKNVREKFEQKMVNNL